MSASSGSERTYIGIDGGGSKTHFLCADACGQVIGEYFASGTHYHSVGLTTVINILKEGIDQVLPKELRSTLKGICFGMPGYGESPEEDKMAVSQIRDSIPHPIHFCNDVEAGWAGAFGLETGICIVSGTGSIGFGKNASGETARSGGWSEFFSDEGSCYWLGKKALELFAKESDGRARKGALYEAMRTHLQLSDDNEINRLAYERFSSSRYETASLQKVLFLAAKEGDSSARLLYEEAAHELSLIVLALKETLALHGEVRVSYTGGLFQTGEMILAPLRKALPPSVTLTPPLFSPAQGAVLLACGSFFPCDLLTIKERFSTQQMI